jgi:hypothetical protein
LPGQKHPGLGLLKEVFGWLVSMAEVLELDGIYYVPSSYHVAIQSRRRVRFLEPEDEALIQNLESLFKGVPLSEASNLIADGRVVDESTGAALVWKGYPMVLPVSPALEERVSGADYDSRVQEERDRLRLAIIQPVG